MKRIVLAIAMMFSVNAFAGTCDIVNSGLPDSVVQKLKTDCESLRLDQINKEAVDRANGGIPTITPERITGWAQVAEGFARALGVAAQQLNVSVNDFIKTPAGMITIGVILWKVIGVSILKFIAMFFVFIAGRTILRSIWKVGSTPVERKFTWFTWTSDKPTYSTWAAASENMCISSFFILAATGIAEVLLLLSLLF